MKLLRLLVATTAAWTMCYGVLAPCAYAEATALQTTTVVPDVALDSFLGNGRRVTMPGFNSELGQLTRVEVYINFYIDAYIFIG